MKNLTRKLLTVLMAVALVFTSVNTVSAVDANDQGTLTVTGLNNEKKDGNGEKVTFYQIVKVTYNGENVNKAEDWQYANDDIKTQVLEMLRVIDEEDTDTNDYESFINNVAKQIKLNKEDLSKYITNDKLDAPKTLFDADHDGTVSWAESAANAKDGPKAGVYIAIAESELDEIYNPAMLTIMYNGTTLQNGDISFDSKYINGATLKSSNPGGDKAIDGASVTPDNQKPADDKGKIDEYDEDKAWEKTNEDSDDGAKTVKLGDKVDYEAYVDIPEYAKTATNKTLWFKDTMCQGLTFDRKFFELSLVTNLKPVAGKVVAELKDTADADVKDIVVKNAKNEDVVIGHIKFVDGEGGSFSAWMEYDNLQEWAKPAAVSSYKIRLDYSAIVNEKAVVGQTGNKNDFDYAYSNNPDEGTTHKDFEEPKDNAKGIKKEHDDEIVYTYEISVLKVDEKVKQLFVTDEETGLKRIKTEEELIAEYPGLTAGNVFLAGAEFDVFKDGVKVGHIVTNANGVATLDVVDAGTYTLKETKAPSGYAFDKDAEYTVVANWTTCVWSNSYSTEEIRYTSDKDEAADGDKAERVGWIKDGEFYEDNAFTQAEVTAWNEAQADLDEADRVYILPAYIKSFTVSNSSSSGTLTNPNSDNNGVAVIQISNGKTPTLPSTGGVGTYIFTIAGVAILATAAFMLIFRKREDA